MELLWVLIVGLVVGALAKLVMPGRDGGGMIVTTLLGVLGSFVAFAIGRVFGLYGAGDASPGILASVIGAVLVLFIYRMVANPRLRV